jgi:hypothetical protein
MTPDVSSCPAFRLPVVPPFFFASHARRLQPVASPCLSSHWAPAASQRPHESHWRSRPAIAFRGARHRIPAPNGLSANCSYTMPGRVPRAWPGRGSGSGAGVMQHRRCDPANPPIQAQSANPPARQPVPKPAASPAPRLSPSPCPSDAGAAELKRTSALPAPLCPEPSRDFSRASARAKSASVSHRRFAVSLFHCPLPLPAHVTPAGAVLPHTALRQRHRQRQWKRKWN